MVLSWVVLIGFIICLAIVFGIFLHFINVSLNKGDSKRIDPLPNPEENINNENKV